jgi:H+/Cl- antiporter ClcA
MKKHGIWLVVAGIGIVDAVLLYLFEFIGINGTDWLWNDVFQSDTHRWVAIPLALVLGIVFAYVVRLCAEKRVVPPVTDLLKEEDTGPVTLVAIAKGLLVGGVSLLAGASLGPEAPLMVASSQIGTFSATKYKIKAKGLLVLASIGALLVAFLGSYVMVLVPLLLLWQRKQLKWRPALVVLLAGLTAYGTILLLDHESPGYGTAPPIPHYGENLLVALVVGLVTALLAFGLNQLIERVWTLAKAVDRRTPWYVSTLLFGLVLGGLYVAGGQSVEFSGSIGSRLLVAHAPSYGAWALLGLIATKALATAWSKGTGYRGGLVFPSIYIGVGLGLLVGQLHSGWGGAGAIIGAIAGMLSAMTGSPVMAAIFVLAILPPKLLMVALAGIAGASVGSLLIKRLTVATTTPAAER